MKFSPLNLIYKFCFPSCKCFVISRHTQSESSKKILLLGETCAFSWELSCRKLCAKTERKLHKKFIFMKMKFFLFSPIFSVSICSCRVEKTNWELSKQFTLMLDQTFRVAITQSVFMWKLFLISFCATFQKEALSMKNPNNDKIVSKHADNESEKPRVFRISH